MADTELDLPGDETQFAAFHGSERQDIHVVPVAVKSQRPWWGWDRVESAKSSDEGVDGVVSSVYT
jgi:hypothetical protein